MSTRMLAVASVLTVVSLPLAGRTALGADDSPGENKDADLAIKLPNFLGLSGMRDMIDARVPDGLLTIRGGVRMQESREDLHGRLFELKKDRYDLQAYAGAAAFSLVEAGARVPFEIDRNFDSRASVNGGPTRKDGDHWGDVDVAGKISLRFGQLALAPYAIGTLPSGDRRFDKKSGGAFGGAGTVSVFGARLNVHANIDGGWFEQGQSRIEYRVGVSVVPLATRIVLVRPYLYLAGRRVLERDRGDELRVAAGVQALLLDFITLEAGGDYRFVSDANPRDLPDDRGTWRIEIGAGVAF